MTASTPSGPLSKLHYKHKILLAGLLLVLMVLIVGHFVPVKSEAYLNDNYCYSPKVSKYRIVSGQKAAFDEAVKENVGLTLACDVGTSYPLESHLNLYLW